MSHDDDCENTNGKPWLDLFSGLVKLDDSSVQTAIIEPPILNSELLESEYCDFPSFYSQQIESSGSLWREAFRVLKPDGTMWVLCSHYYNEERLFCTPFDLAGEVNKYGFHLRNLIVWYGLIERSLSRDLVNRYSNVLFFAKSKSDYKFDLDPIREAHIWRDSEWGGGRKSRYNVKGKNPSNFWLRTTSESGKIISHDILSKGDVLERCVMASTDKNDTVLLVLDKSGKESSSKPRIVDRSYHELGYSSDFNLEKYPVEFTGGIPNVKEEKSVSDIAGKVFTKSSERMDEIPDSSVQLVVTSPPYWGLRDYSSEEQIGYGESYLRYIERLGLVWKECYRVLTDSGSLWINVNKRVIDGDLLLLPHDISKSASNLGFYLREIVVWHRAISVPGMGKKNFTDRYEFILQFTKKSKDYLFKKGELPQSDYKHPHNQHVGNVWRMYRKIGSIGKQVSVMIKDRKIEHTAIYPTELVRRVVLLCTNKGDMVLDPFAGSGTTMVVAHTLGRQWVGYEINEDYKEIINFRLSNEGTSLLPWA